MTSVCRGGRAARFLLRPEESRANPELQKATLPAKKGGKKKKKGYNKIEPGCKSEHPERNRRDLIYGPNRLQAQSHGADGSGRQRAPFQLPILHTHWDEVNQPSCHPSTADLVICHLQSPQPPAHKGRDPHPAQEKQEGEESEMQCFPRDPSSLRLLQAIPISLPYCGGN